MWLTEEDRKAAENKLVQMCFQAPGGPVDRYEVKSQCIGDVFQRFALDGRHVNGNYPMDEDIADSGGIRFSYEDFTTQQPRSLAGKRMFFTALAWCSVERKKAVV